MVSRDALEQALVYQREHGGQIGDCLIALGALTAEQINDVLNEVPTSPRNVEEIDIDPVFLLQLMIKGIYSENLERPSQISSALKLANSVVTTLLKNAVDRKLVEAVGQVDSPSGRLTEMRYALSGAGRDWAIESLERCQYSGPAPVSLQAYTERIARQRITNERVSRPVMEAAFKDLVIPDRFLSRLGPAINSGSAILIHGPTGNGKTTIAEVIGQIFQNVIYIPYCFEVDGQIIKVYDPSIHRAIEEIAVEDAGTPNLRRWQTDDRWVPCYRPTVIVGGELTLAMLDLQFNEIAKFYEAPMHIKALNGTFVIDDFGRQLAKPEDILNRWIVPLNSKVDYLSLHTGKNFQLPFDGLVMFSTNLRPSDLMDPAFQRRLAYKLKTVAPSEALFREIFENITIKHGLQLTDEIYEKVLAGIRANGMPLAYFQPNFIVEQVMTSCRFEDMEPRLTLENVEDAMLNMFSDENDDKIN